MLEVREIIPDETQEELYERRSFTIDRGQEPLRIDKWIQVRIENASRSKIQIGFSFGNFIRTKLNIEHYTPLSNKYTLVIQGQAGINFNQKVDILNDYFIGGLTNVFRNQITFAGLSEGTVHSSSVASVMVGIRYQTYNSLYITAKANALYYNFIDSDDNPGTPNFLSGYSLSLGYNFILGPLEISAMYSDQSKQIRPYINLGVPF